jgi:hypothetical protein
VPSPVDYSSKDSERDIYTIDSNEPLFSHKKVFEKPAPPKKNPPPAGPKPKPQAAPLPYARDLPASFYEANSESYLRARRVAEMKFNTLKLILAYAFLSIGFLVVNVLMYPEVWWCQWPIGAWAVIISFPAIKSFLFRGRDIRSVIESRLHRMALREVERFDTDLDEEL